MPGARARAETKPTVSGNPLFSAHILAGPYPAVGVRAGNGPLEEMPAWPD